jgi:phenylacetate-CoA ligase
MTRIGMELGGTWYKRGAEKYGLAYFNVAPYDTQMRLDYMRRFSPHLLMTSCAYLNRLTTVCQEQGVDPRAAFPELKVVSVGGEAHTVGWAQRMEAYWGVKLHERFGSTQSGGTHLFTCEQGLLRGDGRGVMHNMDQKVILEVLHPESGEQVEPGDEGELVVTNLYMEGFPVIRFRMADRVTYRGWQSCPCGRQFDGVECGTIGRYDDMIKMKSYNIWPDAVDAVVLHSADVAEYAGHVSIGDDGREKVRISIEFHPTSVLTESERLSILKGLTSELKSRTGVTMETIEVPSMSLPRFESKPRRWRDDRMSR